MYMFGLSVANNRADEGIEEPMLFSKMYVNEAPGNAGMQLTV